MSFLKNTPLFLHKSPVTSGDSRFPALARIMSAGRKRKYQDDLTPSLFDEFVDDVPASTPAAASPPPTAPARVQTKPAEQPAITAPKSPEAKTAETEVVAPKKRGRKPRMPKTDAIPAPIPAEEKQDVEPPVEVAPSTEYVPEDSTVMEAEPNIIANAPPPVPETTAEAAADTPTAPVTMAPPPAEPPSVAVAGLPKRGAKKDFTGRDWQYKERGGEALAANRARYEDDPAAIYGYEGSLFLGAEEIEGQWRLVNAGSITPSHDVTDLTFTSSPGFPTDAEGKNINTRDYEKEVEAKNSVLSMGIAFDGRAVSIDSPIVVTEDGVVISGNNRAMSSWLAASGHQDTNYLATLKRRAYIFGFTPDEVENFPGGHPRVVFEIESAEDVYTAVTFDAWNQTGMKEQGVGPTALKLQKQYGRKTGGALSPPVKHIADILSRLTNWDAQLWSAGGAVLAEVVDSLVKDGVIQRPAVPKYFHFMPEKGQYSATASGKEFLRSFILAGILPFDLLTAVYSDSKGATKNYFYTAIEGLLANANLGSYTTIDTLVDILRLYTESNGNQKKLAELINTAALPGSGLEWATRPLVRKMLAAMSKSSASFVDLIDTINQTAQGVADEEEAGGNMFGDAPDPDEVLSKALNRFDTEINLRTAWNKHMETPVGEKEVEELEKTLKARQEKPDKIKKEMNSFKKYGYQRLLDPAFADEAAKFLDAYKNWLPQSFIPRHYAAIRSGIYSYQSIHASLLQGGCGAPLAGAIMNRWIKTAPLPRGAQFAPLTASQKRAARFEAVESGRKPQYNPVKRAIADFVSNVPTFTKFRGEREFKRQPMSPDHDVYLYTESIANGKPYTIEFHINPLDNNSADIYVVREFDNSPVKGGFISIPDIEDWSLSEADDIDAALVQELARDPDFVNNLTADPRRMKPRSPFDEYKSDSWTKEPMREFVPPPKGAYEVQGELFSSHPLTSAKVGRALARGAGTALKGTGKAADVAGKVAGKAAGVAGNIAAKTGDVAGKVAGKGAELAGKAGGALATGAGKATGAVTKGAAAGAGALAKGAGDVGKGLATGIGKVGEAALKGAGALAKGATGGLSKILRTANDFVHNPGGTIDKGVDAVVDAPGKVGAAAAGALGKAGAGLAAAGNKVGDTLGNAGKSAAGALGKAGDAAAGLAGKAAGAAAGAANTLGGAAAGALGKAGAAAGNLGKAGFNAAGNLAGKAGGAAAGALGKAGSKVSNLGEVDDDIVKEAADNATDEVIDTELEGTDLEASAETGAEAGAEAGAEVAEQAMRDILDEFGL